MRLSSYLNVLTAALEDTDREDALLQGTVFKELLYRDDLLVLADDASLAGDTVENAMRGDVHEQE